MNKVLQNLINDDSLKSDLTTKDIIHNGMGPIYGLINNNIEIQKSILLEKAKFSNWQKQAEIIFKILNKNKINYLVFKGFSFTYLIYNVSYLRPYCDIDILIKQDDYGKVEKLLKQLNYKTCQSRKGKYVSAQCNFFDDNKPQTVIDLHWKITNSADFYNYFGFDKLYKTSITIANPSMSFQTIHLINGFLLGCFHYITHRSEDRKHIWLYDLALIWLKMDNNMQFECIDEAQASNQLSIVGHILSLLCKTFPNNFNKEKILDGKFTQLVKQHPYHEKSKLEDFKSRVMHIQGVLSKIQFISEYLFQSRSYVQNRFQLRNQYISILYYPRMWVEDIFKLFKKKHKKSL